MTLQEKIEATFERIPSNGEHYRCKKCKSIFSDMSEMPHFVKLLLLKNHIEINHHDQN